MRAVVLAITVTIVACGPAFAASADEAANELSTQIMSPFCPGVTLHECPSAEALRLRDRIEVWFRDGMSSEQILVRLESEYGRGIRAAPSPSGMGLVAWLVAGAAVLAALATGIGLVRKWSRRTTESSAGPGVADASERRRLDDELARLRTQL